MVHSADPLVQLQKIVAERTTPLLVWIGAGMSVPAGMPSWAKLRNDLIDAMKRRAASVRDARETIHSKLKAAEAFHSEPWRAFQMIKEGLGPQEYEENIRHLVSPGKVSTLPETYELLAKLAPRAVLNLNIDRLATRALNSGEMPTEFSGRDVANYFHVFKSPKTFIANLHGEVEDVSTWTFTENELKSLTDKSEYQQFIANCLSQYCCVFLGISPFDIAVGGHLERLASVAPSVGPHFWFTSLDTYEMDQWAQKTRIRTIRYRVHGDDHSEFYKQLRSVVDYRSRDEDEKPIVPSGISLNSSSKLPGPDELAKLDAEDIRLSLNVHAKNILGEGAAESYERFFEFSREYEVPIYRAWHVSERAPHNTLLGFTLERKAGGGAFGAVYKATSPEGEEVAVKVLHQAARTESQMLQSFRRGVRAMQLLTTAGLAGVTRYRAASEVPAMVVMDWVDGPTLKEVVASGQLDRSVEDRLVIAIQLTEIIRAAHVLPARVLHRDIRPTNIILKDYWSTRVVDVVVLDFDLSWHKDANELSIVQGVSTSGYLAPEQLDAAKRVPTRSALVDSFGIGMTIFFLFSGRDPLPNEAIASTWDHALGELARSWSAGVWKSLGRRVSRLVQVSTLHAQARRWDVSQILNELNKLKDAASLPESVTDAEMLAEELMWRAFIGAYDFSRETQKIRRNSPSGTQVVAEPSLDNHSVRVRLLWTDSGDQNHQRVKKWVGPALDSCTQMLKSDGWAVVESRSGPQEIELVVQIAAYKLAERMDVFARSLLRVAEKLTIA